MSTQRVTGIVSGDDSEIHDEPHVEDSRVTVRYIATLVEDEGLAARTVAERHDLDMADVYAALTYYHANPTEMKRVEARRSELAAEAAAETTLTPPDE